MRAAFWSLFLLGVGAFLHEAYPRSACDRVLDYSVGPVDERFGLSAEAAREAARKAADLWETELGRPLFRYDPAAGFQIRFHYDERQETAVDSRQRLASIKTVGADFDELRGRYEALKLAYEAQRGAYEAETARWSASGGAPAAERERLEGQRGQINAAATQLNAFLLQLKPKAAYLRSEVDSLNARAGRRFDRGDFTGAWIDVYQFDDETDLATILAHEFGHALFVRHAPKPSALMFYSRSEQNGGALRLSEDDRQALRLACDQPTVFDPRRIAVWKARRAK